MGEVVKALERARAVKGQPTCIVSLTHKGQGILPLLTKLGDVNFHGKPVPAKYLDEALAEVSAESEPGIARRDRPARSIDLRDERCHDRHGREACIRSADRNESWARPRATPSGGPWRRSGPTIPTSSWSTPTSATRPGPSGSARSTPTGSSTSGSPRATWSGIAGGLASAGKTAVIASFAAFITCNAYDQLRMSVAYPHLNVKVVGSHAGISIGEDGASQMGIEDVVAGLLAARLRGDRAGRRGVDQGGHRGDARPSRARSTSASAAPRCPRIYTDGNAPFTIGKANQLREGTDVTLVANGLMVAPALDAAEALAGEGIKARVLDMHTVKPIDRDALARRRRGDRRPGRRRGAPGPRRPRQRRGHDRRRAQPGARSATSTSATSSARAARPTP